MQLSDITSGGFYPEKNKIAAESVQKVSAFLSFRPAKLAAFSGSDFCDGNKEHHLMALCPLAHALQPRDKLGGCFLLFVIVGSAPSL